MKNKDYDRTVHAAKQLGVNCVSLLNSLGVFSEEEINTLLKHISTALSQAQERKPDAQIIDIKDYQR